MFKDNTNLTDLLLCSYIYFTLLMHAYLITKENMGIFSGGTWRSLPEIMNPVHLLMVYELK